MPKPFHFQQRVRELFHTTCIRNIIISKECKTNDAVLDALASQPEGIPNDITREQMFEIITEVRKENEIQILFTKNHLEIMCDIQRGAALLNEIKPGWIDSINAEELTFEDGHDIISLLFPDEPLTQSYRLLFAGKDVKYEPGYGRALPSIVPHFEEKTETLTVTRVNFEDVAYRQEARKYGFARNNESKLAMTNAWLEYIMGTLIDNLAE